MRRSKKKPPIPGKIVNTKKFSTTNREPWSDLEDNTEIAILEVAKERAEYALAYWREQWDVWSSDVDFIDGNQWDAEEAAIRRDEGRLMLTMNTFDQYIYQILGDILQNRPSIQVSPGDSQTSEKKINDINGLTNYNMAQVYEGLIRQAEYANGAEAHYDTAAQHAVESGMGWLRVGTKWSTDIDFNQELTIHAIRNRWSVLMDPDCIEPDMSDANYGFLFHEIARSEFDARWPDATADGFDGETTDQTSWWASRDKIKIVEYFERIPTKRRLVSLSDGRIMWEDEILSIVDELGALGVEVARWRDIETNIVYRRLISSSSILETRTHWPGSTIPIVPVSGKRIDFADKSIYRGAIHNAKDAKIAENYYITASAERIGVAPLAPWIVTADQIEGRQALWDNANKVNTPYLVYNYDPQAPGPPNRIQNAPMPVAEIQMAALFTDKVKAAIGIYDSSLGNRSNETSGRAILARQRQSNTGQFVFADNLNKALRRIGKIAIEVFPHIFDTDRVVRMRNRDGTGADVHINQSIVDEQTGKTIKIHDLNQGKFDVVARAGPSYTTQREEAAAALMEFIRVVPSAGAVVMDMVARNMDWPGADMLADRLIKMVPRQFLTEQEIKDNNLGQDQPTPDQQAAMANSQAEIKTAEANISMAKAKQAEALAKLEAIRGGPNDALVETIKNLIAQGLAEVLAANQQPSAPAAAPVPNQNS